MWSWVTEHLVARVSGQEVPGDEDDRGIRNVRSYTWELLDLIRSNQGMPRLLIEGASRSFGDAELQVREHVGKCYDARLGYRKFAGSLAFTYSLASGEQIDVSSFIGTRCSVTVLLADGSERTVAGDFSIDRYRWVVRTLDEQLEIVPEHVVRLTNRSEVADRAASIMRHDSYTGIGRMYRQEPRKGCTGRPGFTVGTVDHAGAAECPIHESGLPEHLLR